MPERRSQGVKVRIPLQPGENHIRFPNQCAYCGEPASGSLTMKQRFSQKVGQTGRGPLAKLDYHESVASCEVPFCRSHYMAAWVGKWIFGGIMLVVWILSMGTIYDLAEGSFWVEGDFIKYLFLVLALLISAVISWVAIWSVQRALGLVFPVVYEIKINPFQNNALTSLLGVQIRAISYTWVDIEFENLDVAQAVRLLNVEHQELAGGVEEWQQPRAEVSPAESKAKLYLGRAAIALGGILGLGTLAGWLVILLIPKENTLLSADTSLSLGCMTGFICVAPALVVGGILTMAGRSQLKQYREEHNDI